ncbi:MAG: hypothetical protein WAM71_12000 [Candidatus Korobacteraceae bacterium]
MISPTNSLVLLGQEYELLPALHPPTATLTRTISLPSTTIEKEPAPGKMMSIASVGVTHAKQHRDSYRVGDP